MKPGHDHLEAFLAAQARRGLRPRSLLRLRKHVSLFYEWWQEGGWPGDELNTPCLEAFRLWLAELPGRAGKIRLATLSWYLGSLRAFCHFLAEENVLDGDPSVLLPYPNKRMGQEPRRLLDEAELARLCCAQGGGDAQALRDRALVEVLVATAMRPREALELRKSDVDLGRRRVRIRRGKGERLRWLPLTAAAHDALRAYVTRGRRQLRAPGLEDDRLFLAVRGDGATATLAITIVARAAELAGITGRVTPYTLRHSVATSLARAGMELRQLQALLGHEHIATTELYIHLGPADLKSAHRRAHPRERNPREPRGKRDR